MPYLFSSEARRQAMALFFPGAFKRHKHGHGAAAVVVVATTEVQPRARLQPPRREMGGRRSTELHFRWGSVGRVVAAREEFASPERVAKQTTTLVAHLGCAHVQAVYLYIEQVAMTEIARTRGGEGHCRVCNGIYRDDNQHESL